MRRRRRGPVGLRVMNQRPVTFSCNHTLISDWYGTSREFAADLMESSKCCGNRREIVCVDGFKLGNAACCALAQSRYSDESLFSQNALSAASFASLGMAFGRLLMSARYRRSAPILVTRRGRGTERFDAAGGYVFSQEASSAPLPGLGVPDTRLIT
jgi:hypothetical protein